MSVINWARKTYHGTKYSIRTSGRCKFIDRSKQSENLCIVLAGYKQFLWPETLTRLQEYAPDDYDVCLLSSGIFSNELNDIAKNNNWSYLSTKRNNLSLAQNLAIRKFPNAKFIFKMDEDIFVTENTFSNLKDGLIESERQSQFFPGFVAPVINVNNFSYMDLLEYYELKEDYRDKVLSGVNPERGLNFNDNPEAAGYMWGNGSEIPQIDVIAQNIQNHPISNKPCPIRFNIGLVLFRRSVWEEMNGFKLGCGNAMGIDEEQLDVYCLLNNTPPIVIGNSIVGHFGFGGRQSKLMKELFDKRNELFQN